MPQQRHGSFLVYSLSGSKDILCLLYKIYRLKIAPDNAKALLILDNAPANESVLVTDDGHIRVILVSPKTTSLIQPMDQGIISALKKYYIRQYLDEVLDVLQENKAEEPRGERILTSIKHSFRSLQFYIQLEHNEGFNNSQLLEKLLPNKDIETKFKEFENENSTYTSCCIMWRDRS